MSRTPDIPHDGYVIASSGSPDDVRMVVYSLNQYDAFVGSLAEYHAPAVPIGLPTTVLSTHGVAASIALPMSALRRPIDVCYAWDWEDTSSLLLALEGGSFPALVSRQPADVWWMSVNGRPTLLTIMNDAGDGRYYASVKGYLHENFHLLAIVGASTVDRRHELIGVVATLQWRKDEVPAAVHEFDDHDDPE